MIRRKSTALLIVTVLLLMAVVPAHAATEQVNLVFAMWIGGNPGEPDAQRELIQRYMDENPHVNIELIYQGWNGYHDRLYTMAAGGVTPDIMAISRIYLPIFVERGIVQPIDPWLSQESPEFLGNIVELVSGTYRNQVYGFPIWGGPIVAAYNADLFEQAGLAEPKDLAQRGDWTWDIFVDYGKRITRDIDGDGRRDVFMHAGLGTRPADWYIKVRGFGADVLTPDGKPFTDVGALERGLEFWASLAHEHRITPLPGESSGLVAGTEAVYFSWISDVPSHYNRIASSFRLEIAPPPAGPAGLFTPVGGVPISVSSITQHPEEAYKFARWYAMESGHWKIRGTPPGLDDMTTSYRDYLGTMVSWPEAVVEAMAGAVSMEPGVGPYYDDLNRGWNQVLAQVARGEIAPREGAIRIIEHTQATLGE